MDDAAKRAIVAETVVVAEALKEPFKAAKQVVPVASSTRNAG